MSTQLRDEFPERIKRTIAERAGYICAKCRRPTVGPHSDPEKSLKTGEACHICAAAPGGPRYDPEQTHAERSNIENAIWLCTECSTRIDKDEASYSIELLLEWKRNHETWLKNGGILPSLPRISLVTLAGRSIPDVPGTITARDCEDTREHSLKIENVADVTILTVDARVQLPEPIIQNFGRHKPAGVDAVWQPVRLQTVALIKGGGSVTRNRPPLPTNVYQLQIDRIPPKQHVDIGFVTSAAIHDKHDIAFDRGTFAGTNDPPYLRDYIDGTFQFEYQGAMLTKRFFAPIAEDKDNRQLTILEVREDFGEWKPLTLTFFS